MKFIPFIVLITIISEIFCKPNILFIIVDDLRPNIGVYGYDTAVTPNIDKLASKSFVFKNAFCQQALCAPSRNSLLTSRRPDSLGLYDFYSYWRHSSGNFTTLPQHFKENGYYTHSIGKVFHPGKSSNFSDDMPYSWTDEPFHPKTESYKNAKVCVNSDGTLEMNLLCPVKVADTPEGTLPDLESLAEARDFLNYRDEIIGGRPFFLAVGFHKPHIPFKFPVEYLNQHPIYNVSLPTNRWRPYSLPNVAWNPWIDIRGRQDVEKLNISFPFGQIPDFFVQKIIQHYNAAITYIDDLIGQLIDQVAGTNTVIVLVSDHGWSAGEHGEFSKYSNFDISTRVPLLIHVPNLSRSQVIVDQLVELVDIFPTLVDITQVSPALPVCDQNGKKKILCTEGRSLVQTMVKVIKNESLSEKQAVFSQYPRPGPYPTYIPNSDEPRLEDIRIMGYSVRTVRHRYTEWVGFNNTNLKPNWTETYGAELYDHSIDPHENMNLIDRKELGDMVTNLRTILILGWRFP